MRATKWIAVGLGGWLLLLVCSSTGGKSWFSPDTLAGKFQGERLVWFVGLPVWLTPVGERRYALADYLVEQGYWRPQTVAEPEWWLTDYWNMQWRDGHSPLHRELSMRAEHWIEWTEENPDVAVFVWPYLLRVLRSDDLSESEAKWLFPTVLIFAENCDSVELLIAEIETHHEFDDIHHRLPSMDP